MPLRPKLLSIRVLVNLALAGGCAAPQPQHPTGEIELGKTQASDESPEAAGLRPCKKDDTSCAGAAQPELAGQPELDPNQRYAIRIGPSDPRNGPADAPVTLVVFSDFQCPFCKKLSATLAAIAFKYEGRVSIVWKDLPLSMHQFALPAALLAREAFAKGGNRAFWRVHDALFVAQADLSESSLARIAERFELSWPALQQHGLAIDETFRQVEALNIRSTPTTFVNGRPLIGAQPVEAFEAAIDQELQRAAP